MNLTGRDFAALLPLLIVSGAAVLVMISVAIRRSHAAAAVLSFAGLAAAFASLWPAWSAAPRAVTPLLAIDPYAIYFMGLILAGSMAFVPMAWTYFRKIEGAHDELYILMLVATLGSMTLACASHFISLFLGLELLSVALYGMIAYLYRRPISLEAGLKYLVLAAASAAFLLFGMALIYAALGSMTFAGVASALRTGASYDRWFLLPGMALMITGFGFKLAVFPFHLWTPDVYEGAPAPVTAYVASVSKGAMFALLLRYFYRSGGQALPQVFLVFSIVAIASMIAGNVLALLQRNVKRILAYSSIAHLGYLLVAFQAGGELGSSAVAFYLAAYFVTTLGAFGVVSALSDGEREADDVEDYRGLFWRRPALAAVFTAMLLSLAGIPLTGGFIGKFYVVAAGASSAMWALIVILVVTSAIGLYYYLRIVVALYSQPVEGQASPPATSPAAGVLLALLTGLLLWFGIYPGPLLSVIRRSL